MKTVTFEGKQYETYEEDAELNDDPDDDEDWFFDNASGMVGDD